MTISAFYEFSLPRRLSLFGLSLRLVDEFDGYAKRRKIAAAPANFRAFFDILLILIIQRLFDADM